MDKIRVLHFELSDNMGGIESFLYNLYSGMDRNFFQFDFITRTSMPANGEAFESLGAKIYKVSNYFHPVLYGNEISRIIDSGYDVVHIHKNSAANIIPFSAVKNKNCKIIAHSHNTAPSIKGVPVLFHSINKKYLWNAAQVHLACSEAAGHWLYGEEKNFCIVKNGIESKQYIFNQKIRDVIRDELRIKTDAFVVGHVGRFVEQKNHTRLLAIFYNIVKVNKKAVLLLIGSGELENSIKEKVQHLGIEEQVLFLGRRSDVSHLMQAMDVFLMPSFYEGLPIVAVEAQAAGLRVYLSDTISKETEITDGVRWFSNEEEAETVAQKICLDSIYTREERVRKNKEVVRAGYDITNTRQFLSRLYQNCRRYSL